MLDQQNNDNLPFNCFCYIQLDRSFADTRSLFSCILELVSSPIIYLPISTIYVFFFFFFLNYIPLLAYSAYQFWYPFSDFSWFTRRDTRVSECTFLFLFCLLGLRVLFLRVTRGSLTFGPVQYVRPKPFKRQLKHRFTPG